MTCCHFCRTTPLNFKFKLHMSKVVTTGLLCSINTPYTFPSSASQKSLLLSDKLSTTSSEDSYTKNFPSHYSLSRKWILRLKMISPSSAMPTEKNCHNSWKTRLSDQTFSRVSVLVSYGYIRHDYFPFLFPLSFFLWLARIGAMLPTSVRSSIWLPEYLFTDSVSGQRFTISPMSAGRSA
jgi:hypothetical protein